MSDLAIEQFASYFEGIKNAQSSGDINPADNLALAILGEPKTGKSWLAATIAEAVGVTFAADFDNRAQSIAGKPNIFVKTYVDLVQVKPMAMKALELDIERFKYNKANGKLVPKAFILDSMSYLKRIMENEIFEQSRTAGVKMFREVKTGSIDKIMIPEGWDSINSVRDYMLYMIGELRSLGHVICVFHERPIVDKTLSTEKNKVYTGKIGVDPPYLNVLLSVFNEVWRIQTDDNGKYKVYVRANRDFNGATSLHGLDDVENPNIAAMLEKHAKAFKAKV